MLLDRRRWNCRHSTAASRSRIARSGDELRRYARRAMAVRIDVFTIFPGLVDAFCAESLLGRARDRRAARPALPRPARPHHRRPPLGRRHALRRRRRHGAAARAGLRRRRGGRPAPAALPARPGRPPLRPGPGRGAGRRRRASRLLCGRYEGVDAPGARSTSSTASCRSATTCSAGGEVAAVVVIEAVGRLRPRRDGQRRVGGRGVVRRRRAARGARSTPGRPTFRGWAVPEVLRSGDHGAHRPLAAGPGPAPHAAASARTWSRPGAGSPTRRGVLLREIPPVAYPAPSPVTPARSRCAP